MDLQPNSQNDVGVDALANSLHFQLVEAKMIDIKDEIRELRESQRIEQAEYRQRLDKLDTKLWGIIALLPISAAAIGTDVLKGLL